MKSAAIASPVISAISLKVSPALELAEVLPHASVAQDRDGDVAAQDDAKMRRPPNPDERWLRSPRTMDARSADELAQALVREAGEQGDFALEERDELGRSSPSGLCRGSSFIPFSPYAAAVDPIHRPNSR
jgi:hypothetical protein